MKVKGNMIKFGKIKMLSVTRGSNKTNPKLTLKTNPNPTLIPYSNHKDNLTTKKKRTPSFKLDP